MIILYAVQIVTAASTGTMGTKGRSERRRLSRVLKNAVLVPRR